MEQLKTLGKVEMMACLLQYKCSNPIIIIILYKKDGIPAIECVNNLTEDVESAEYRKVIFGDFILDLRLQRNQDIIDQYAEIMNMKQKVEYTTHI